MKLLAVIVGVLFVVVVASTEARQQRPDFSGHWLQEPPGQVGISTFFGGRDFTATQDDKTLTIVRTTSPAVANQPGAKSVFKLDGSESANSTLVSGQEVPLVSKVTWDGKKMVVVTTYQPQGHNVEGTQIWSITDSGLLRIEQKWTQDGRTTVGEKTYKKN